MKCDLLAEWQEVFPSRTPLKPSNLCTVGRFWLVKHSQRQLGQKGRKKAFLGEARAKSEHAKKSRLAQTGTHVNGLKLNTYQNSSVVNKFISLFVTGVVFCYDFIAIVLQLGVLLTWQKLYYSLSFLATKNTVVNSFFMRSILFFSMFVSTLTMGCFALLDVFYCLRMPSGQFYEHCLLRVSRHCLHASIHSLRCLSLMPDPSKK